MLPKLISSPLSLICVYLTSFIPTHLSYLMLQLTFTMLCHTPTLLSILPSFTLTHLSSLLSSPHALLFYLCYTVLLLGNIGCMVNGAGLAMATMDIIKVTDGDGGGVVAGGSLSFTLLSSLLLSYSLTLSFITLSPSLILSSDLQPLLIHPYFHSACPHFLSLHLLLSSYSFLTHPSSLPRFPFSHSVAPSITHSLNHPYFLSPSLLFVITHHHYLSPPLSSPS